jgi:predicted O-methyltransferase YrrM
MREFFFAGWTKCEIFEIDLLLTRLFHRQPAKPIPLEPDPHYETTFKAIIEQVLVLRSDMEEEVHPLDELLSKSEVLSRNEPEVAANIGEQLKHMELQSLPLSVRRRIRDVVARVNPQNVVEVGAGIGHLSAWLYDLWSDNNIQPERYVLVEGGGKFGVILKRLMQRYDAGKWSDVIVGEWNDIVSTQRAWVAANASNPLAATEKSPLPESIDVCIIDVGWKNQNECVMGAIPLLGEHGLLLTSEPEVPTEDEVDEEKITAFNEWIMLIKMLNETHDVGFVPMFAGTLIGIKRRSTD